MPRSWRPAKNRKREHAASTDGLRAEGLLDPLDKLLAAGFAVVPAAAPREGSCSCDRLGCPTPAAHPLSRAWQVEASADPETVARWRSRHPGANWVTPTGKTHSVLDVPDQPGADALRRILVAGTAPGPVAEVDGRYLFFIAPRSNPDTDDVDEDEWWSSSLDCRPETLQEHPGLRWHDRGSYVFVPPSVSMSGRTARWVYWPADGTPLPDAVVVLEVLADVLAEFSPGLRPI
ncbi:bifunctional DNA primase/polymerase [Catenulispora pinisilvae]|uniref:bifunctional DNA primase/polymerase n=1 Tax=Catenulispora pinisilvae TaxID=2705253 RepID=UPI00189110AA|nr:bifunctional DNA primase/polymerase [Catenulispora pinisilvae]